MRIQDVEAAASVHEHLGEASVADDGQARAAAQGPHFLRAPKFIRSPSPLISLAQQLLIRFCLVSKSNFSKSFKQTPISSLEDEAKKMYSSRLSSRPFISGRTPNFLLLPLFLVGLYRALYRKLELRAIVGVGVNLEASKK